MKSKFGIQKLDDVNATLTVTMRISDWRELREQQGTKYPGWKFGAEIAEMIRDFNTHFYGREEDAD